MTNSTDAHHQPPGPKAFRGDIQGLRAVAVTAVVLEHVSGWPRGGFTGVDVFFVVSGYLITGLLLRERARTGRISMLDFYQRRIRRLFPAAATVIVATLLAAFAFFPSARFLTTVTDAGWSAVFLANWHFAQIGTDYFQAAGPVSPFQHFWSLAVEEQFYVVWPLLVILLLVTLNGGDSVRRRSRIALASAIAVATVLSFLLALEQSRSAPTVAYFSTLDRAWELGVGVLLATTAAVWERIPVWAGTVLMWVGLATVIIGIAFIRSDLPFPGPWALPPVLGTAAVLVGGSARGARVPIVLANAVSRSVGDISYSLYLWHFPVYILIGFLAPDVVWVTYPVGLAMAVLSYHAVERPALSSPWLTGVRGRKRVRAWRQWRSDNAVSYRWTAMGAIGVAATLVIALAGMHVAPRTAPTVTLDAGGATRAASPYGPAVTAMQRDIQTALQATTWPTLDPAVGPEIPGGTHLKCGDSTNVPPQKDCTFGPSSATRTAVLVGDSTAMHELDALVNIVQAPGSDWRLVSRAAFECSFIDANVGTDNARACQNYRQDTLRLVKETRPDLLIVTNTFADMPLAGTNRNLSEQEFAEGLSRYMDELRPAVGKIVHITPPPAGKNIQECYQPSGSPASCITRVDASWLAHWSAVQKIAGKQDTLIDSRPLVCIADACPSFIGTTPVRKDWVHFSAAFQQKMTPALQELLAAHGVLSDPANGATPGSTPTAPDAAAAAAAVARGRLEQAEAVAE